MLGSAFMKGLAQCVVKDFGHCWGIAAVRAQDLQQGTHAAMVVKVTTAAQQQHHDHNSTVAASRQQQQQHKQQAANNSGSLVSGTTATAVSLKCLTQ